MLNQFDKTELEQLNITASKRSALHELKDVTKEKQMKLVRELNRCQAIAALFSSQPFQHLLESTASRVQQFQTVQKEYQNLPESRSTLIERVNLTNKSLQRQVCDLKQLISRERQREERIEQSLQSCQNLIDQLITKKEELEVQVDTLKQEIAMVVNRKQSLIGYWDVDGLDEEQIKLLQEERYDELIFRLSKGIKSSNTRQASLLVELAQRYLHLQQIKTQHQSAQRLFSSYSSCESQHDLIAEEENLGNQITAISKSIIKQKQAEQKALEDCQERVRQEAVRQAQQWITRRLDDIGKKKKTIHALLQIMVEGDDGEEGLDRREIEIELWKLQQEQGAFRQKLQEDSKQF